MTGRHRVVRLIAFVLAACCARPPAAEPPPRSAASMAPSAASMAPAAAPPAAATVVPAAPPLPESVAEAERQKAGGASWSNRAIREHYLALIARIAPADETWKKDGLGAEERARRAYQMRHDAWMTARAMMGDPQEVADLQARDREKYGNPDGPTFEQLVESGQKKGRAGDELYEAIVKSAGRTDTAVNEMFGLEGKPP
jgi:hypothetical protein